MSTEDKPRMMMRTVSIALFALLTACSATTSSVELSGGGGDTTIVNGNLSVLVHDFVAQPGVLWALPSVQTASNAVIVGSTRYGSRCQYDVLASASVTGSRITLDITYSERLALCTAEIRGLTYTAQISGLSGTFDLFVVHHENARADTLVRRAVDVR